MSRKKTKEQSNEEVTLGIYVMSYKRSDAILTNNLLEDCTYVVRKEEEEAYRKAGIEKIVTIDDPEVNNAIRTYWWLITNLPEDIIFVMDDDVEDVMYRLDENVPIGKNKEIITSEIERIAQLMVDLDIGYACNDATAVPYGYDGEFAFKGTSGSMKWVYKKVFKAKMDESVKFNYDIDIIMQELLHNRIVLKPRYLCGKDFQDTNSGGDSNKVRQEQIDSINNMKLKWGKYFDYNFNNNRPSIKVQR